MVFGSTFRFVKESRANLPCASSAGLQAATIPAPPPMQRIVQARTRLVPHGTVGGVRVWRADRSLHWRVHRPPPRVPAEYVGAGRDATAHTSSALRAPRGAARRARRGLG